MKRAALLGSMMFVQYAVLTVNTRAIASGSYFWLFVTDLVVATLGFSILRRAVEATTKLEMFAYAFGGAAGAQVALLLSHRI